MQKVRSRGGKSWGVGKKKERPCSTQPQNYYFTAIVSISIRAPRGRSFTAKAALAGQFSL